jgi:hypothetical protein
MSENNLAESVLTHETASPTVHDHSGFHSRKVSLGDTSPRITPEGIESFEIKESVAAAQEAQLCATSLPAPRSMTYRPWPTP